jgi:hypothetical protein
MILITGANQKYSDALRGWLEAFQAAYPEPGSVHLIVWDLGLEPETLAGLQEQFSRPDLSWKQFEFHRYPDFLDIRVEAGQYAWKPALIWETAQEFPGQMLVWMDAGNRILRPLTRLQSTLEKEGVYSPMSSGIVKRWTHPLTLERMGVANRLDRLDCRNGACLGFALGKSWVQKLLEEWKTACLQEEVIAPPGSNRKNHRQDQAVFTILYYKFWNRHGFGRVDEYLDFQTHTN